MSGSPSASVASAPTLVAPVSASMRPTIDPQVKEADRRKWDGSKVPEYDGTNFCRWDRAITREFMMHNAEWLLEKRLPGDDIIHKRALVFIRQTVDETHENLIDDCKDAYEIYANVTKHHKAWLRINMPRLQEELAMIRQHIDESAGAYLSLLTAVDECSRYGFVFPLKHKSDAAISLQHLLLHTGKCARFLLFISIMMACLQASISSRSSMIKASHSSHHQRLKAMALLSDSTLHFFSRVRAVPLHLGL
jgi:hypothetical protein